MCNVNCKGTRPLSGPDRVGSQQKIPLLIDFKYCNLTVPLLLIQLFIKFGETKNAAVVCNIQQRHRSPLSTNI